MTDPGVPSLRQRKHAATALSIEQSAVALVLEHGIDAVTVDMICEAAGVSQRTFFNYFKTKDAAILGPALPRLDERRVREFLASDSPDLLGEIMGLFVSLAPFDTSQVTLAASRMRIVGESPGLLRKEMERLFAVRDEMEEVLFLRLRRSAPESEPEIDTREQAALITHIMAGVLRFTVERRGPDVAADPARMRRLLGGALARLLPEGPPGP
ncbi:MAG: hypothetical protein RI885_2669 [Actinomycetota bacterium]